MKLKALLFLLLAAVLPLAAPRPAQAADVSFDYFYDALLPHGEWIEVTGYGFCWRPTEVEADWTPYADGYWTFTDAGWTWVGYEDFAGIVYHYGRWVSVEGEGWCWVPDYEWGPAWVSWRKSDDYIGWAPLPPRAYWQPEIGISTWADTAYDIGPAFYSFCRVRDFGAPVLRPVIISRARNVTIIRTTVNITNITYNSYGDVPVIYNSGPSFTFISGRSDRPIPALKLVRRTHFDRPDFHGGPGRFSPNARTVGNQLIVNAPIVAPPVQPGFLKDKVKKVFAADKVGNGWAGVKDAQERTELRQRFQRETKGLTPYTAPARAVLAADLKVVPAQADPQAVLPGFGGRGQRGKGDRPPAPVAAIPVAPTPVVTPPPPATPPAVLPDQAQPANPRIAAPKDREREKGRGKNDGGPPLKPVVVVPPVAPVVAPIAPAAPVAPTPMAVAPGEGRGEKPKHDAPVGGFHKPGEKPQPVVGDIRPAKPVEPVAVADPAPAQAQAAAEAAKAAREQAAAERQKMEAEKLRAAQADTEKVRGEQERASRQRDAEAGAAAVRQKQAAETAAAAGKAKADAQEQQRATQLEREKLQAQQERAAQQRAAEAAAAQQKQRDAQRQADAEKQAETQRQQAAAAAQERLKQQQEQIAEQRRQLQAEQQKAAQGAAKHQAAERAREQQAEQQRAAEAQRQQAARQQQIEQQRAAQEAAKQQAQEQHRAQQAEQQRAAQDAARQQAAAQQQAAQAAQQQAAQEQRRGEKEKDKDKDKGR